MRMLYVVHYLAIRFLSQSVTFKDTQGKVTKAAEKAQKKK